MANSKKGAPKKGASKTETAQTEETSSRAKKKFFVVNVATLGDDKQIIKSVTYPETTTNEKAIKMALKEYTNVVGVNITGYYENAKDLIKAMSKVA
jgi:hypothetical protein